MIRVGEAGRTTGMAAARDTVQKFYDLFAAGKITESAECFDPNCMTLMPGGAPMNQAEHEATGHAFNNALPDSHMVIDQTVESGDEVVVMGHFVGTQTGDFVTPNGTIPATGRPLNLRFVDYFKVVGGKIVDHQIVFDQMEMMGQLGVLPGA
jgi:predicted ester cyclase